MVTAALVVATRFRLAIALVLCAAVSGLALFALLELGSHRDLIPYSEPWAMLLFVLLSLGLVMRREQRRIASVRLFRAEWELAGLSGKRLSSWRCAIAWGRRFRRWCWTPLGSSVRTRRTTSRRSGPRSIGWRPLDSSSQCWRRTSSRASSAAYRWMRSASFVATPELASGAVRRLPRQVGLPQNRAIHANAHLRRLDVVVADVMRVLRGVREDVPSFS